MENKKITFEIVTPEKVVLSTEVYQATIPTKEGQITVLPEHISLVSILVPGEILIKKEKEDISMAVSGGFVQVSPNKIIILADTAERAEEIDEERAEAARKRAEDLRNMKTSDDREFAALTAVIERELARIKISRKYKR